MAKNLPIKLNNDPIAEALFEIRFQSQMPAVSTLLPGLMFASLGKDFDVPERLLLPAFPPELLAADPNLKYQPSFRIKNKDFVILLGDHSLVISCPRPYVGWDSFKKIILNLVESLNKTNLISEVERFSVKYLNVLPGDAVKNQFKLLKLTAQLGDFDLTDSQTAIQSEIVEENLVNLVEIRSNVTITQPDGKTNTGILVSVDTICIKHENFWNRTEEYIDKIHSKEKHIFYSLLTDEAVNACDPVWK